MKGITIRILFDSERGLCCRLDQAFADDRPNTLRADGIRSGLLVTNNFVNAKVSLASPLIHLYKFDKEYRATIAVLG